MKSNVEVEYLRPIVREAKKEDKDIINDLYEKLLANYGSNVGIGHRLS